MSTTSKYMHISSSSKTHTHSCQPFRSIRTFKKRVLHPLWCFKVLSSSFTSICVPFFTSVISPSVQLTPCGSGLQTKTFCRSTSCLTFLFTQQHIQQIYTVDSTDLFFLMKNVRHVIMHVFVHAQRDKSMIKRKTAMSGFHQSL